MMKDERDVMNCFLFLVSRSEFSVRSLKYYGF
jgi:hypothetical protein